MSLSDEGEQAFSELRPLLKDVHRMLRRTISPGRPGFMRSSRSFWGTVPVVLGIFALWLLTIAGATLMFSSGLAVALFSSRLKGLNTHEHGTFLKTPWKGLLS